MRRRILGWVPLCLLLAVGACNPPKGACVLGRGMITASCGDDFTSGSCGLVNGDFFEGQTCADLGFTSSLNMSVVAMSSAIELSVPAGPDKTTVVGAAAALRFYPDETADLWGMERIELRAVDIVQADGTSLPRAFQEACPSAAPMPALLVPDEGEWRIRVDSGRNALEGEFRVHDGSGRGTLRLARSVPGFSGAPVNFTSWSYESHDSHSGVSCEAGGTNSIAVTITLRDPA